MHDLTLNRSREDRLSEGENDQSGQPVDLRSFRESWDNDRQVITTLREKNTMLQRRFNDLGKEFETMLFGRSQLIRKYNELGARFNKNLKHSNKLAGMIGEGCRKNDHVLFYFFCKIRCRNRKHFI